MFSVINMKVSLAFSAQRQKCYNQNTVWPRLKVENKSMPLGGYMREWNGM